MKIVIDILTGMYEDIRNGKDGYNNFICTAIRNGIPLPKCKDCKHFEYDRVAKVNGISLILGHEICAKWGNGCKTKEDGYCFLFEPKESEG